MKENYGGRSVEKAEDRFLARDRMPIFLGQDMPQTIAMKEVVDNELDIVSERGMKATECTIQISPSRLRVMDNGDGISAIDNVNPETGKIDLSIKPSLWDACAVMFTSSNYTENSSDTLGANGVGLTLSNYTSAKFSIMNFNGRSVRGYEFTDGYLNGNPDGKEGVPEEVSALPNGDHVAYPYNWEDARRIYEPVYETGFLVDVTWHETPNELFQDKANINWLFDYIVTRVGELRSGEVHVQMYEDHEFKKLLNEWHGSKNEGSENYVQSWDEKVEAIGAKVVKIKPWTFAFGINQFKVESICQGAPIKSRYEHTVGIQIQDYNVSIQVPFSMKYQSDEYPPYTDQTKTAIRFPYSQASNAFEHSDEVYKHFYREAEKAYMAKVIEDSESGMFWPCLGPAEEGELIIAEGYSAISGLKSQRDPITQACIALRGVISNTWNMDMVKAMRSDVVKQILNAVMLNKYRKVIMAVDADDDGSHIASLLIALFYRFTNVIQEGRLYYAHTPHYLFKKRGKDTLWSDNAAECPGGYHVTTLKGIGGMTAEEVGTFIMNEETRDLIRIEDDPDAEKWLDHAFSEGGEKWIIE